MMNKKQQFEVSPFQKMLDHLKFKNWSKNDFLPFFTIFSPSINRIEMKTFQNQIKKCNLSFLRKLKLIFKRKPNINELQLIVVDK